MKKITNCPATLAPGYSSYSPKAVKILCKNFNCIFNNEELELIGKMARAIFNDLIPDYINKTEDPTTGGNGKKVSNIIPFPKRA